ncbi:MAG: transposase [Gammaproteobacteria bacterium]
MPRTGRLYIPGGYYHLLGRGLEKRSIFEHTVDKLDFLTRFSKLLRRTDSCCLAWALMSNHYHFLVKTGHTPLKKLMAPVLGGFAGAYNRRHDRCGYVFQNRFTSILCEEQGYLLELIRYIHLNPVRAGLVEDLESLGYYPWTGHAGLLGRYRQDWHSTDLTLTYFNPSRRTATGKYMRFMQAGVDSTSAIDLSGGGLVRSYGGWEAIARLRQEHKIRIGDERILGASDFVEKMLQEDEIGVESRSRLLRKGWDLERLISVICNTLNIEQADLLKKARANKLAEAKAVICYWGNDKLGVTTKEIANRLGISQPAVSKWIEKGRKLADNARFTRIID